MTEDTTPASISAAEAILRASGDSWLLDVREQDEWDTVHSPLAHLIPMSVISMRVAEVPVDTEILVVCHSGARSQKVTAALRDVGYNAVNVAGGMVAWQSAGGDVISGAQPDGSTPPRA